jgi:membrane glycosyltransferase
MMLIQSGSVAQILSGRDTGWNPQRRDDGSIPLKGIARRHRAHTLLGLITLFAAMLISPSLVIWMSPTIAGLIFSIPLSWASGNLSLGLAMRRIGLLRTPEETSPPVVVGRANALAAELARTGRDHDDALKAIWADPALRAAHESFLADAPRRRRGDVEVEAAVAAAKLNDAQTLEDARAWLNPRERLAVLSDRALIAMLARLSGAADQPNAA